MGKKYIIELLDDCQSEFKGIMVFGLTQEKQISVELIPEESLRPYTEPEPHAEVTADAYQRGYETAKHECEDCPKQAYTDALKMESYQKGLNDAWEAAREIGSNSRCSLEKMGFKFEPQAVAYYPSWYVVQRYSASECIEKIRQYEQEKEEIKVGDEVNAPFGKAIVVNINSVAEKIWLVYADGHGGFEYFKDAPRKTGRHFPEIAAVLQKMKESDNG